jgi:hypothetical protein
MAEFELPSSTNWRYGLPQAGVRACGLPKARWGTDKRHVVYTRRVNSVGGIMVLVPGALSAPVMRSSANEIARRAADG